MHKIDFNMASSGAIEDALSRQIEAIRLQRNITQSRLAREAGVSRSTMTRLAQQGKGISLDSFIRILQALQLTSSLEALLPDPELSPLQELAQPKPTTRQRARSKNQDPTKWTWPEDGDPQ